jgi:ribosomal-protein-alanine N-acetyltransferase
MQGIKIRAVDRKDLSKIYEIEKLAFKNPYPKTFMESLYHWNPKSFLIAEREEEIIGYVVATTQTDVGQIISIAVKSSDRRKGVGRDLITAIINILHSIGMNSVRLEVKRRNVTAQKFYESLGFEYSHTIYNYYGNEDAFVFFKFINRL